MHVLDEYMNSTEEGSGTWDTSFVDKCLRKRLWTLVPSPLCENRRDTWQGQGPSKGEMQFCAS